MSQGGTNESHGLEKGAVRLLSCSFPVCAIHRLARLVLNYQLCRRLKQSLSDLSLWFSKNELNCKQGSRLRLIFCTQACERWGGWKRCRRQAATNGGVVSRMASNSLWVVMEQRRLVLWGWKSLTSMAVVGQTILADLLKKFKSIDSRPLLCRGYAGLLSFQGSCSVLLLYLLFGRSWKRDKER